MYLGICMRCRKSDAKYELTRIIDGEKVSYLLCEACYLRMTQKDGSSASGTVSTGTHTLVCPVCGMSFSEYQKSGLLGCGNCYMAFRDELMPIISRIQQDTRHVGKAGLSGRETRRQREIEILTKELETAVREKRYTDASEIRGTIDAMTKEGEGTHER